MKFKRRILVPVEKPNLLFMLAVNVLAAIYTQTLFAGLLFPVLKQIVQTSGLSEQSIQRLFVKATLISCGFTCLMVVVTAFMAERTTNAETEA